MKRTNANKRIKIAMRDRERQVMKHVRKFGTITLMLASKPWRNAVHRLEADGKLRYSRGAMGYVLKGGR